MPSARRFPPPWIVEEHNNGCIVRDATGVESGQNCSDCLFRGEYKLQVGFHEWSPTWTGSPVALIVLPLELSEDGSMTEDTQADLKLSAASEERQKQKDAGDQICSPYLLRPLRTLRQACSDISASHPELIPPGIDGYANVAKYAEYDYSLAIKNKGRPPQPWRWEIYLAGKSKPVEQSEFFETMSEATRTGKAALAELQAKRAA